MMTVLLTRPDPGGGTPPSHTRGTRRGGSPGSGAVAGWRHALARVAVELPDAQRVDLIAELEALKSAAAAVQARLAAAMADDAIARLSPGSSREAQARAVRSVAGQVGLARRISPNRAGKLLGLARMLTTDLPETLLAVQEGRIGEWQATLVGRETVLLTSADRRTVDRRLADCLGRLGDRALAREARRLADQIDTETVARRVKRAEADRCVTVRPAPGPAGCAMARLTATMPVAQAVGVDAGLRRQADTLRGQGDARGIGQIMSDELFTRLAGATPGAERIEGTESPDDTRTDGLAPLSVEIGLVLTERTLFRGGTDPAVLTDDHGRAYATVPAALARRLARTADRAWLTRLYAHPASGELVAMDSTRRTFTGRLRQLLVWRDQTCRTPWCDAPIRHADHATAHATGGDTALANGAGLCEACNYLKEAPGWHTDIIRRHLGPGQVIQITTPTGHHYRTEPPPAPGHQPRDLDDHLEQFRDDWDDGLGGVTGVGGAA